MTALTTDDLLEVCASRDALSGTGAEFNAWVVAQLALLERFGPLWLPKGDIDVSTTSPEVRRQAGAEIQGAGITAQGKGEIAYRKYLNPDYNATAWNDVARRQGTRITFSGSTDEPAFRLAGVHGVSLSRVYLEHAAGAAEGIKHGGVVLQMEPDTPFYNSECVLDRLTLAYGSIGLRMKPGGLNYLNSDLDLRGVKFDSCSVGIQVERNQNVSFTLNNQCKFFSCPVAIRLLGGGNVFATGLTCNGVSTFYLRETTEDGDSTSGGTNTRPSVLQGVRLDRSGDNDPVPVIVSLGANGETVLDRVTAAGFQVTKKSGESITGPAVGVSGANSHYFYVMKEDAAAYNNAIFMDRTSNLREFGPWHVVNRVKVVNSSGEQVGHYEERQPDEERGTFVPLES